MKTFVVTCFIFCFAAHTVSSQSNAESLIPLNFAQAINKLNQHNVFQRSLKDPFNLKHVNTLSKHVFKSLIDNSIENVLGLFEKNKTLLNLNLNISQKCSVQFSQFAIALKQEKMWALEGYKLLAT